jgi:UDP:flavonoid glycosyltransferase YjiC (YdhE family)
MRISILALGSNGDVTPCAALGGALARRGHQVRLASHEDFSPLAEANNLAFTPVAPPSQILVARAGIRLDRLVRQFVDLAGELARGFSANELRDSDLILNQLPGGLYGWDLAEKAGIPMVELAYLPIIPTAAFPAIGWPRLPWPAYNRATYRLAANLIWNYFRAPINRWRKQTLGLPPQPRKGNFHQLGTAAAPWLAGFSPALIPPPSDWDTHVHVTGYWHSPDGTWQPSPDLLRFLDQGQPPVFIGFGSMSMQNPTRVTRIVLEALRITGLRAVLHTGWAGLASAENEPIPENIISINYAPYTWLFKRMAGVVIHGGAGAVHCAARAGVPTLVVPFLYDQFGWGKRIHELKAGPPPLPFKKLASDQLALRLGELVNTPVYAAGAADLGRRIQPEDGLSAAVEYVEKNFKG